MNPAKFVVAAVALSVSSFVFAAGGHHGAHGEGVNIGAVGKTSDTDRTITVQMHDNYYEPESIAVKPGETVRFLVENKGSLVHEFNIGTAATHEAHQEEMMMMVNHGVIDGGTIHYDMMDMGNGHSMKHDDPNSVLLEPGKSQELVWTFAESGTIEFACNVPGHYQAGMYGEVVFD